MCVRAMTAINYRYQVLHRCQWPQVVEMNDQDHMIRCGEAAPYFVWWPDGTTYFMCERHFDLLEEKCETIEREERERE